MSAEYNKARTLAEREAKRWGPEGALSRPFDGAADHDLGTDDLGHRARARAVPLAA
jgi:hypothetical protein